MSDRSAEHANSSSALDVIYANDHLLIVNKPPDVAMDGDLSHYPFTVESMAYTYMKEHQIYDAEQERLQQMKQRKKQLKFVHQLDYATSGVLCLAFSKDMASRLAHCFEMRSTRKYYVALLHGHLASRATQRTAGVSTFPSPHVTNCCSRSSGECSRQGVTAVPQDRCFACIMNDFYRRSDAVQCQQVTPSEEKELHHMNHDLSLRDFTWLLDGYTEDVASPPPATQHKVLNRFSADKDTGATSPFENLLKKQLRYVEFHHEPTKLPLTILSIKLPVGPDATDEGGFRMSVCGAKARDAETHLLVLQQGYLRDPSFASPHPSSSAGTSSMSQMVPVSLVLLAPRTGRRHQLRVHCRAMGCPILGDVAYSVPLSWAVSKDDLAPGGSAAPVAWLSEWPRMYLHAWRLLLPSDITAVLSEQERVEQKKKRRRETLGLEGMPARAAKAVQRAATKEAPIAWDEVECDIPRASPVVWTELRAEPHFPPLLLDPDVDFNASKVLAETLALMGRCKENEGCSSKGLNKTKPE